MNEKQWKLIDDLLSEFEGDDGWYNIGLETQQALRAIWDQVDLLREENKKLKRENASSLCSLNMLRNAIDSAVRDDGD